MIVQHWHLAVSWYIRYLLSRLRSNDFHHSIPLFPRSYPWTVAGALWRLKDKLAGIILCYHTNRERHHKRRETVSDLIEYQWSCHFWGNILRLYFLKGIIGYTDVKITMCCDNVSSMFGVLHIVVWNFEETQLGVGCLWRWPHIWRESHSVRDRGRRRGRAPPKPPLFLNGSLSLFGWPSLSAKQGDSTGFDPELQLIY